MDYSYYTTPQSYDFFALPQKPGHPFTPQEDFLNDPIDAYTDPTVFPNFDDQTFQFQPQHSSINLADQPTPPPSLSAPALAQALPIDNPFESPPEVENFEHAGGGRSSDEDKELTPAQNRRKAQNRAAQRAFRERKERHVRDLEVKLSSLSATNTQILSEKERLAREVERLATQNEILRATSSAPPPFHPTAAPARDPSPVPGPQAFSPSSFESALASRHNGDPTNAHKITISQDTGERMLRTGAAWDLISSHPDYKAGRVDLGNVYERLKEVVICDGQAPSYREGHVRSAIEDSVSGPGDELI